MKTAEQLKNEYERNLKKLQSECKHPKTDWALEWWAPAHASGREVLSCMVCWKVLKYRMHCVACKKQFTTEKEINASQDTTLCDECQKKGKYCSQHNVFYNKNEKYCPECQKFMDAVEKWEK